MPYVCESDMGSAIVFSKQVDLCTQSSGTMHAKTENAVTREWRPENAIEREGRGTEQVVIHEGRPDSFRFFFLILLIFGFPLFLGRHDAKCEQMSELCY
eukprot:scaffold12277_cov29-Attheya_sp.AAC.1